MIKVTKQAAKNIRRIIQNHKGIFFGIKGGGCHGFEYILKPTNEINGENVTTLTAVEDIPWAQDSYLIIPIQIQRAVVEILFQLKNENIE